MRKASCSSNYPAGCHSGGLPHHMPLCRMPVPHHCTLRHSCLLRGVSCPGTPTPFCIRRCLLPLWTVADMHHVQTELVVCTHHTTSDCCSLLVGNSCPWTPLQPSQVVWAVKQEVACELWMQAKRVREGVVRMITKISHFQ